MQEEMHDICDAAGGQGSCNEVDGRNNIFRKSRIVGIQTLIHFSIIGRCLPQVLKKV